MNKVVNMLLVVVFVAMGFYIYQGNSNIKTAWTTKIEKFVKHTVTSGDTLDEIAKLYGTTKIKILKKNIDLKSIELKIGQKLVVPINGYQEKLIL